MNIATRQNVLGKCLFCFCISLFALSFQANAVANDVIDKFLGHLASNDFDQAKVKQLSEALRNADDDESAQLITDSLTKLFTDYGRAVEASDDDVEHAKSLLEPFTTSGDRFLAADSSFYLARAFMNNERFEEAMPLLEKLRGDLEEFSANSGVVQYFLGVAYAGMLQHDHAIKNFMEFLQFNPDAPERLRVAAWRQVQQLQAIEPEKLDDVYYRMDFSRRRLEITEPGERTQEEQDKIVQILAKLIKEQEKKECSQCNSAKNQQQQQQQQQQAQNKKQQQPSSQTPGQSNVANGKFIERTYDTGNDSPWNRLRDRSRDPANTAVKEKLPPRYKEIVERYFDAVNGNRDNDK